MVSFRRRRFGRRRYRPRRAYRSKRRSYTRRRRSRAFTKRVKRTIFRTLETKGTVSDMATTLSPWYNISTTWSYVDLFPLTVDGDDDTNKVSGTMYTPRSVFFKNAVMTGGFGVNLPLQPDDSFNLVRILLIETVEPIAQPSVLSPIQLDSKISYKGPVNWTQYMPNIDGIRILKDKTVMLKPKLSMGGSNDLSPDPKFVSFHYTFKPTPNRYNITNGRWNKYYYLAMRSDSTVSPHPGFTSGRLYTSYKDN